MWTTIDAEASALLGLLSSFGVSGIPAYEQVDLEYGMQGDGIPDRYQLALLSALLCFGNEDVQGQFDANKLTYTTLVDELSGVLSILIGNPPTTPTAPDRLRAVAVILTPLVPTPVPQSAIDDINSAATELDSVLASVEGIVTPLTLPQLTNTLKGFKEAVAALLGMDSEIQASVTDLLTSAILGQVMDVRQQVVDMVAALTPVIPLLAPADQVYVNALITDINSIVAALDFIVGLTVPGAIPVYGVVPAKSPSEPFSGLGDYDKNGYSNLAIYTLLTHENNNTPPTVEAFVVAASNPLAPVLPSVPVAGLFGLAALAGACLTGGAFTLRKK